MLKRFEGEKRAATIRLVRILFPGAGVLVLSAWCLGVLNSHRRFFLSYTAPVLWNLAIILSLLGFGRSSQGYQLAEYAAWGSVVGSVLQFGVQLPVVLALLQKLVLTLDRSSDAVRRRARRGGRCLGVCSRRAKRLREPVRRAWWRCRSR